MADRLAENGAIEYAQASTAEAGTVQRLAGAGQIEADIRKLVADGFYTSPVSGLSVRGRLINKALASAFSPLSLFSAGEQGVWYDPSDLTTMFQDAAGTTPVTAVEQPVGLLLDKSKGLVLGSELVVNGTFDSSTANWTAGTNITLSVDSQRLKVVYGGSASQGASQTLSGLTVGRTYILNFTFIQGNVPTNNIYLDASNGIPGSGGYSTSGTRTIYFTALSTTATINLRTAGTWQVNDYFFLDNISVKELAGNHATQSTSTSRPVLSARYNLLTYTEQFNNAVWTKTASTISSNATTAPDGTLTADKYIKNNAAGFASAYQLMILPTTNMYFSFYAKKSDRNYVGAYFNKPGDKFIYFNIALGTVGTVPAGYTATITDKGNGWYLCTVTSNSFTADGTNTNISLFDTDTDNVYSYTGDGVKGTYIWGASLVPTNQSTIPYQRVAAATDYDTDAIKFPKYLKFDGVDDSLATASVNFTTTDKMTVWAGVRKLAEGGTGGLITELSADSTANNGSFYLFTFSDNAYYYRSRGTNSVQVGTSTYTPPITNVLTGIGNISGDVSTIRVNGTQIATSASDQGTGNYGNYPLYIGSRAGTSLRLNGQIYSLIIRGAASTATQITNTETYVNSKTKAY